MVASTPALKTHLGSQNGSPNVLQQFGGAGQTDEAQGAGAGAG
jgi:hypothetical protein